MSEQGNDKERDSLIADLREPRLGIHEDGTEELKTWDQLWEQCQRAADALAMCSAGTSIKPVAWYRVENGVRVYYETEAWPDMMPLYSTFARTTITDAIADAHSHVAYAEGYLSEARQDFPMLAELYRRVKLADDILSKATNAISDRDVTP